MFKENASKEGHYLLVNVADEKCSTRSDKSQDVLWDRILNERERFGIHRNAHLSHGLTAGQRLSVFGKPSFQILD